METGYIPKVIWMYWHSGWGNAPLLALKCKDSWIHYNPNWEIRLLDNKDLEKFLPKGLPQMDPCKTSEVLRVNLLKEFGGVWADASAWCNKPLDDWLPDCVKNGFFAFAYPAKTRLIAEWFLASTTNNYMIRTFANKVNEYWQVHNKAHKYFWFSLLFENIYNTDLKFNSIWNSVPKVNCPSGVIDSPHYFVPFDKNINLITDEYIEMIKSKSPPVLKLTFWADKKIRKIDNKKWTPDAKGVEDCAKVKYLFNTIKKIKLFCYFDGSQPILLKHFLIHYSKLGVTEFNLVADMQATSSSKSNIKKIIEKYDVNIKYVSGYHSNKKRTEVNDFILKAKSANNWIVYADLDEFANLEESIIINEKFSNLPDLFLFLESRGLNCLRGWMCDKISKNGKLDEIIEEVPIYEQYPLYCPITLKLGLDRALTRKIFCFKPVLSLANSHDFVKPNTNVNLDGKMLLVIDHYKWDSSVTKRLQDRLDKVYTDQSDDRVILYKNLLENLAGGIVPETLSKHEHLNMEMLPSQYRNLWIWPKK